MLVRLSWPMYYDYGDEEIEEMVTASEEYILQVGPLPTFVRSIVQKERFRRHNEEQAAKELRKKKDGNSASMEHYWVPDPTIVPDKFGHTKSPIPQVYLQSVCAGIVPDIHFWTEGKLDLVLSKPHHLITKELTLGAESDAEEVTVVDLSEMHKKWGTDEDWTCITAMGYAQALQNVLTAVKKLVDAPAHPAAHDLESHIEYICSLPHFEESYPYWYSWERETRNKILSLGISFSFLEWEISLCVPLEKYRSDKYDSCLVSFLDRLASFQVLAPIQVLSSLQVPRPVVYATYPSSLIMRTKCPFSFHKLSTCYLSKILPDLSLSSPACNLLMPQAIENSVRLIFTCPSTLVRCRDIMSRPSLFRAGGGVVHVL
ncbi:hypothetical protein BDZ89DRAFT_368580 [Hymenopellis radicata]|nr:hypothetical protein BDZ89DRAFT_368580 [Hymenopellis radicata]